MKIVTAKLKVTNNFRCKYLAKEYYRYTTYYNTVHNQAHTLTLFTRYLTVQIIEPKPISE